MNKKLYLLTLLLTFILVLSSCNTLQTSDIPQTSVSQNIADVSDMSAESEATEEAVPDPECLEKYVEFLEKSQEMNTHVMTYKKGEGKFALVYVNNDNNPELLIIGKNNHTLIHTYNPNTKEVELLQIADGGTDIPFFRYDELKFGENHCFISETDTTLTYYELVEHETYDYAVSLYAFTRDDLYYCNTYSTSRMCSNGFEYRSNMEDNRVSDHAYNKYLKSYGFAEGEFTTLSDENLHFITPEGIREALD